jgi:flagellar biosynthesis protein FlhA
MSSVSAPRLAAPGPWTRISDLILPIGMIASLLVIMVPVPAELMDFLLAANITIAVIMLLTTLYVRTPLEFNVFPSLLLTTTLFRLVLNVATTRLILTRAGSDGLAAAGGVVRTFGHFVTGGATGTDNIVVGLIIFSIIVLIQFVVITKGATRISEVAARFTLDGMPGRQMAIDADLNSGIIDEHEAQRRRQEIIGQADFFGAMDGASKFVRGDAIAGLVIILINIVGGLFIGVVKVGMSLGQAGALFTTLTIGDGLVTQIPAFLISLAAGLLVTRSSQESNLPREFLRQFFSRPQVLAVAAGFLGILIFTGLPRIPLFLIGVGCAGLAVTLTRREQRTQAAATVQRQAEATKRTTRVEDYLTVDPMELELGVGLIRFADARRGGDLLERIQRMRQNLAAEMGLILPKVRVRDNMRLEPAQYRIKIADVVVAQGTIDRAASEPGRLIIAQLTETVHQHADELLTRDAVKHLVDERRQTSPATVDELIPGLMKLGEVQQVLQLLLREAVSIRQLGPILETLGDHAPRTKDLIVLTECVRQRLARTICTRYRDQDLRLFVVTLDPVLEERVRTGFEHTEEGLAIRLSPREADGLCRWIAAETDKLLAAGRSPIVLVDPQIRPALKLLTAAHLPQLVVLSYHEITRDTRIEAVGMVADAGSEQQVAGSELPTPQFRRLDAVARTI